MWEGGVRGWKIAESAKPRGKMDSCILVRLTQQGPAEVDQPKWMRYLIRY